MRGWRPTALDRPARSSQSTATRRPPSVSPSSSPELGCNARFERGDFADVLERLVADGMRADVVYMDLGVSSMQLDEADRGFSYSTDAPLDMRMDTGQPLSAREIVNEWATSRLATVLREFGEERHARSIAFEIERRRPLETTSELVEAIRAAVPPAYRFGRGHPAKRSFQAIRIAVNGELESLDRGLVAGWDLSATAGASARSPSTRWRTAGSSASSQNARSGCVCPPEIPVCVCGHEPEAELITRRAVKPSEDEIERNPRSRSARLRVARKLGDAGSPRSEGENARR